MEEKGSIHGFPNEAIRVAGSPGDLLRVEDLRALWERMVTIRIHEEIVEELNSEGLIRGSTHLYIGMEAGAVGVISATTRHDVVIGYFRSHGHALALGMPAHRTMGEILGRTGGCCGGRGGTKHLMDVDLNYLGAYAIVGQQMAMSVGLAHAVKHATTTEGRPPSVVVCFYGDGAANQGTALEALNLASIFELPCLFICENNQYAVSSAVGDMVGGGSIAARTEGFGIESKEVDGMDVCAVREAALAAREAVVSDGSPRMLELLTYRFRGHSVFQVEDSYRDQAEVRKWKDRDPIAKAEASLLEAGLSDSELHDRREEIRSSLEAEAKTAKAQPLLEYVGPTDMYADSVRGLEQWGTLA